MIKAHKTHALEKLTITRQGNKKNSFGHTITVGAAIGSGDGPSHAKRRGKTKAV